MTKVKTIKQEFEELTRLTENAKTIDEIKEVIMKILSELWYLEMRG